MTLTFRMQFGIIAAASVALLALAALLVWDAVSQMEGRLLDEAQRQVEAACRELRYQFDERERFASDDPLHQLPVEARDLSLRGLAETVLRSYEGVQGGFYFDALRQVAGASGSQPLPESLHAAVSAVAGEALASGRLTTAAREQGVDSLVMAAAPTAGGQAAAWVAKRLAGVRDPVSRRRRWMLAGLVLSALLGMAAIVSAWYSLQAGVNSVRDGLARLETDFQYRLPERPGDFGRIASAINQMTSRRLALETELRRQDRLAALGRAAAGVAHEIRNPLNSLKLSLELLARRLSRGAPTGGEVKGAIQEVDRLDQIVGRWLAFGRPALTDRHLQDLTPLMEQAVRMVGEQARQKGVEIALRPRAQPLAASVDGPQIVQVIVNLLLNAIEASPPGSVVNVKAEAADGRIRLTVEDHGVGIPPEAQPHVFDIYFTTKADGVGLGLSVSREIVANHGGGLDFTSRPGHTEFQVTLPAIRREEA